MDPIYEFECRVCWARFAAAHKTALYCSSRCRTRAHRELPGYIDKSRNETEAPASVPCSIPDCEKPAKARGWCHCHYGRWRRHGDPLGSASKTPGRTLSPSGYVIIRGLEHPLARQSGQGVFEHRVVLYDAIGAGPHPCHYCRTTLRWRFPGQDRLSDELVVDHVDGDRENNALSNLVPACVECNSRRSPGRLLRLLRERYGESDMAFYDEAVRQAKVRIGTAEVA